MKKLIVFVDDEKNVLSGIKRNLFNKSEDWELHFFEDSKEALEFIKSNIVELIVSDMKMPSFDGLDLMQQVSLFSPSTIRIILSGHTDEDIAYQSVKSVHQFLSKPVKTEDLVSIIEKSLQYRGIITNTFLKDIVNGMSSIPLLPSVFNEISTALELEETTFKDIGSIVEKDIGLTASLLKVANSAFFGISREVTNPIDATMYLGTETVKHLLLFISVFSKLDQALLDDMGLKYLWEHSFFVAKISKSIANHYKLKKNKIEAAYTAGLLHDLGRLILATNFPDDYKSILELGLDHETFRTVEKEIFGADHAMVGAYLASIWGLPMDIVHSIWCHHIGHTGGQENPSVESIVMISNVIYHKLVDTKYNHVNKEYNAELVEFYGFNGDIELLENIAKKVLEG